MGDLFKASFLVLGGATLLFTGMWFVMDSARFLDGAERTTGKVVDIATKRGSRGMNLHHPVIRYQPAETSTVVEFTARPGLWPSPYRKGDLVEVAYHASSPQDARVVSFWMLWFLPVVTILFGVCCLFAGWHTYRYRSS